MGLGLSGWFTQRGYVAISRRPDPANIKNAYHLIYEGAIALLRINTRAVVYLDVLRCT